MNSFPEPEQPHGLTSFTIGNDGLLLPIWRALGFGGVAYFSIGVVGALYVGLSGTVRGFPGVAYYSILTAVLLFESWIFIRVADQRTFRTLGLWFYPGWWREALGGIGVGLLIISIVVGVMAALHAVQFVGWGWSSASMSLFLPRTAVGLALAAVLEELLFRGYGFQRLIDAMGSWGAAFASSIIFGVAHLQNPSATALSTINTALSGGVLAVAYLKTRGLWLPIGLHWAWNFCMGSLFSFPVSGLRLDPAMFQVTMAGPVWLTGGSYGPEGGIVLTAVAAGAIVWLALDTRIGVSPEMQEALE